MKIITVLTLIFLKIAFFAEKVNSNKVEFETIERKDTELFISMMDYDNNQTKIISDTILRYKSLNKLEIFSNCRVVLPDYLNNLSNLKTLVLNFSIDDSTFSSNLRLKNLSKLSIGGYETAINLPFQLVKQPKLETIKIPYKKKERLTYLNFIKVVSKSNSLKTIITTLDYESDSLHEEKYDSATGVYNINKLEKLNLQQKRDVKFVRKICKENDIELKVIKFSRRDIKYYNNGQ